MTSSVVLDSCRLTVISPKLRVDLAVPAQMTVGELLSIVVSKLGREAADEGVAQGGWMLQRAAEPPFDPSSSLSASQIRDGDILHLRTRATRLPEVAFDDVLDAVSTGVLTRTSRWEPIYSLRAAVAFSAALLTVAVVTVLSIGPAWTVPSIVLGVCAVLLAVGAIAVARAFRRAGPAQLTAGFAIAYATACGATSVGSTRRLLDFGAPQTLVGAAAAVLMAVVLLLVLGTGFAGLVTVTTLALLTALGTAIASGTSLDSAGTAAVIAAAGLALSPVLPLLSFRLSRLPLPAIPTDAADLRRDTATVDAKSILGLAVRADQILTGLVGGAALAIGGSALFLSGRGVSEYILAVVLGLICLLRARLFTGRGQRILLLVGGGLALLSAVVAGVVHSHGHTRLLAFGVPAVILAIALIGVAITLPERRSSPPMARAADIIESILVLSVIPLALGVMGVYGAVRHFNS